jgi:hypothetical protein
MNTLKLVDTSDRPASEDQDPTTESDPRDDIIVQLNAALAEAIEELDLDLAA